MNGTAFDGWTLRLQSRRAVGRTLIGLGVGFGITRSAGAAQAPDKKGKVPSFGCTKQDSICTAPGGSATPCPDAPIESGGFCANNKGKPFCAVGGLCAPCKNNRDCTALGFAPDARCIKKCPSCQAQGTKSRCLDPLPAA